MARPVLHGADYSVYVRIARMALAEKGVAYDLAPVDIFADSAAAGPYAALNPFGKIPAFEHDGFRLYETAAITRYVDEGFDGHPLQPTDARSRATMNQIVGIVDSYAYRALVWDIYVETVSKPKDGKPTDETRVAAALPVARTCLAELARLKRPGNWVLGDHLSLADIHLAPVFGYFTKAPVSTSLLAGHPELVAWWARMQTRPSFVTTAPIS